MNLKWILLTFSMLLISCSSTERTTDLGGASATYPTEAALNRTEGYVGMQFDISEEGKPFNIKVIESVPEGVFDRSALLALSKWRYKPKKVDGVAVTQIGMKVQLDFKVEK